MTITTLPLERLVTSTDPRDFPARRSLSDISLAIAKCRRAVVISGAGISCSSGIPDFRSADGLYNLVKDRYPDAFCTGKDLFSSGLFSAPETTSLFYSFIAELSIRCAQAQPTRTHHFIGKLQSKGKLLRSYTQNIDGLERRIGLESGGRGTGFKKRDTKNVEMHGDLGRVRCVLCCTDFEALAEWMEMFREGSAPDCPACHERSASRISRSARATAVGTLRPSIVLYDEPHPLGEEIGGLQAFDLHRQPDILLVMGTSLKVHGLKKVVKAFAKAVHSRKGMVVFVNATPPSKEWEGVIDYHIHGQTDMWVDRVEEEWKKVRPQDWETQTRLNGEVIKEMPKKNKGKSKAKADEDKAVEPVQLPTPRSSQSPIRRPRAKDSSSFASPFAFPLSDLPSSPIAPPTPLSPSKRRANIPPSPVSECDVTPSKKRATLPNAPITGLPGTPGRGNLFASPSKAPPHSDEWEDLICATKEAGVFGTPKGKSRVGRKRTTSNMASTPAGKENVKPVNGKKAAQTKPKVKRLGVRRQGNLAVKA